MNRAAPEESRVARLTSQTRVRAIRFPLPCSFPRTAESLPFDGFSKNGAEHLISVCPSSSSSSAVLGMRPSSSRTIEQTAPVGERRAVGDCATFALPGDVLTAGTRDGVDDHVSWQQPVTASTALGRSVHPVRMGTADRVANISSHAHHIGISNFSNPGRCINRYDSLSSSRRVVASPRGLARCPARHPLAALGASWTPAGSGLHATHTQQHITSTQLRWARQHVYLGASECVHPAAHPPRLSTAVGRPAPEPQRATDRTTYAPARGYVRPSSR